MNKVVNETNTKSLKVWPDNFEKPKWVEVTYKHEEDPGDRITAPYFQLDIISVKHDDKEITTNLSEEDSDLIYSQLYEELNCG